MMFRTISIASLLAALAVPPAHANFGGGSKDEPQKPASTGISSISLTPRQEAERLYTDGLDEIQKAKKDLEAGKAKNAGKKYKKALDRGERALGIDPRYHEAWNLVGYSSRQLKDYDRALAAYDKCLALKPDYAPAREYLGVAWLMLGNLDKAREQMAWLDRTVPSSPEAGDLRKAIAEYQRAHPSAAGDSTAVAPPDTSRGAPSDTTAKSGW
jgi:tetratricopeptide (TPR) repeat protein